MEDATILQPASSSVPVLLNFQGSLSDPNGAPIGNASVDITFSIYQQETGGTLDWSETHHGVSTDAEGRFAVSLNSTGQASGDLANLFRNSSLPWLEVSSD